MTTRATMRELFAATAMIVTLILAVALCGPDATAQTALSPPPKKPEAAAAPKKDQGPQNALQGFSQNRDQPVKIRRHRWRCARRTSSRRLPATCT